VHLRSNNKIHHQITCIIAPNKLPHRLHHHAHRWHQHVKIEWYRILNIQYWVGAWMQYQIQQGMLSGALKAGITIKGQ